MVAIPEKGMGTGEVKENALGEFEMDTMLETDFADLRGIATIQIS